MPVALFSLEMSETELAHRFLASQARVSSDELRKGRVRAEKWPKVLQAVEKLASAPIFVDDSSDMSVLELRAKSRRLAARHGLGLVVVDYLQLMRPEGRPRQQPRRADRPDQPWAQDPGPRADVPGDRGLPALARRGVPQPAGADALRPPRVGQLEQDADLVMFIYRDRSTTTRIVRAPGDGRRDHRQAPQRPDREGRRSPSSPLSALRQQPVPSRDAPPHGRHDAAPAEREQTMARLRFGVSTGCEAAPATGWTTSASAAVAGAAGCLPASVDRHPGAILDGHGRIEHADCPSPASRATGSSARPETRVRTPRCRSSRRRRGRL